MKQNIVYVVDVSRTPLMPTRRFGKVRRLMKEGKAVPICSNPFTIRLKYKSTGNTQPIHVGIDSGRENIGIAASKDDGECLFLANVETKNKSIKKNMDKRRGYRRERRSHKRQKKQRKAASRGQQMKKSDGCDSRHHGTKLYPYREVSYPGAEEPVRHKVIQGKEAKFINRTRPKGIETSFREIKYCLDMICFHARKTNSIMQEIYAAVIMYNFCERLTLSVVISVGKRKHEYQANFSMGIHICMDFFRDGIPIEPELEIEKYILPVRPDRTDKRKAVKAKSAVTFNYRFVSITHD